jgi:hypothetical protein
LQQVKDGGDPRLSTILRIAQGLDVDLPALGLGPTQSPADKESSDPRLRLMMEWLAAWWDQATPEERIWAEIQMGRAFPEYLEFVAARASEAKPA